MTFSVKFHFQFFHARVTQSARCDLLTPSLTLELLSPMKQPCQSKRRWLELVCAAINGEFFAIMLCRHRKEKEQSATVYIFPNSGLLVLQSTVFTLRPAACDVNVQPR